MQGSLRRSITTQSMRSAATLGQTAHRSHTEGFNRNPDPDGIALKGKEPSNLVFRRKDGRTICVTQREVGFIESFRTDREGREHRLQRADC